MGPSIIRNSDCPCRRQTPHLRPIVVVAVSRQVSLVQHISLIRVLSAEYFSGAWPSDDLSPRCD